MFKKHLCMYVCMYVCMNIYIYIICMHTYMHTYLNIYAHPPLRCSALAHGMIWPSPNRVARLCSAPKLTTDEQVTDLGQ